MAEPRAVIFDLDGTLIDSLPDLTATLNRSLARHGLAPLSEDQVRPMVGDGSKKLLERGYAVYGKTPTEEDFDIYSADYEAHVTDQTKPFDSVGAMLETLHRSGLKLGICSNKPHQSAERILDALHLKTYFPVLIGADQTAYRKPDPRHLAEVLKAMGVAPRNAIMVGDHRNDLATAQGLDVPAIFVSWGYGKADAPVVANRASEVPGLVEKIFAKNR
jgi:phosphoglycolate phosphatase